MLIHLSRDPNLTELIPRIPECAMRNPDLEDVKTERICFGLSITRCLRAVKAMCNTVYHPLEPKSNENRQFVHDILQDPYDQMDIDFMNNAIDTRKTSGRGYPIWYAYQPISDIPKDYIVTPTQRSVYDVDITHEVWVTCPVKVSRFATILLQSRTRISSHDVLTGSTTKQTVYEYDYEYSILSPDTLAIRDDKTTLVRIRKEIDDLLSEEL